MRTLASLSSVSDNVISVSSTLLSQFNPYSNNDLFSALGVKSHGTIIFDRNHSNRASFIRISSHASAMKVKEFLIQRCCKQSPSLVMSITGSAKERGLKSKLFRIFQQNLLKAARNTNIWIITDGMNTSIGKLVGQIVRTNPDPSRITHLIGIASWKSISAVDQFNVHGDTVYYQTTKNDIKNETLLEPNHTEFIFIDDEREHIDAGELKFRAKFERAISAASFSIPASPLNRQQNVRDNQDKPKPTNVQSVSIPVVLLVVEGDLKTVQQVHEAVVRNNIPVVLFEGTGKCCDLFAKAYHLYNEYQKDLGKSHGKKSDNRVFLFEQNELIKNKIQQKVQFIFNEVRSTSSSNGLEENENTTDYFQLIYECIETHNIFLNFVDFKTRSQLEPDVDLAILQALLIATSGNDSSKSNSEQKQEQINLALEWNRVDIVKNFIMKNEQDWKTIELNDLFEKALIRNQISFVQLFLDHDFPLDDLFRNNNKLLMLYKSENHSLRDDSIDPLRAIYTEIIQPLVGHFFDVDAVLSPEDILHNEQLHRSEISYSPNMTQSSGRLAHTKYSRRHSAASTRSKDEHLEYYIRLF